MFMGEASYRVFEGDLEELADKITGFCRGEYGDRCEFYQVSIERVRDGGSWKVHEFQNFEDRTARAVRNHLSAGDVIRVRFGGEDPEVELVICPGDDTAPVSRFLGKAELEGLEDNYIVVSTGESAAGGKMLEGL